MEQIKNNTENTAVDTENNTVNDTEINRLGGAARERKLRREKIEVIDKYVGLGYAISRPEELEFIKQVARKEAVILDPVYTGKAMYGVYNELKEGGALVGAKNILFICGGAFEGIEKIIEKRLDRTSMGFNAEVASKKEKNVDELLKEILPQDLIKFGIIPELVGRVPINVTLEMLDRDALIRILTEPKSAIVKQYKKLLELDGVELEFEQEALEQIADTTLARKTGARGLRAIMENVMMDTMYHVPSNDTIKTCLITKNTVLGKDKPIYNQDAITTQSA